MTGERKSRETWTRFTRDQVLEAVEKGITISGTARVLGCSRETVRRYAKQWKAVARALRERRQELVDLAEMALRGAVLRGEPWAVTFALRTLGKEEGYTERLEHTGPAGKPQVIEIVTRVVRREDRERDPDSA